MTQYLFRARRQHHHFLTTDDPTYRYETLCGLCDYPIEADEEICPRCQTSLEDCSVCRDRTHRRAPVLDPNPHRRARGVVRCSLCEVHRVPAGHHSIRDLSGTFCTNLYGCPAGGLLTRTGELALWPVEAHLCLICRDETFRPRPAKTFIYHVRQCPFCSSLFGTNPGAAESRELLSRIDEVPPIADARQTPCPLCGRQDRVDGSIVRSFQSDPWSAEDDQSLDLTLGEYQRVVELGRAIALHTDRERSLVHHLFELWFDPLGPATERLPGKASIPVMKVAQCLIEGTRNPEIQVILQERIAAFLDGWRAEAVDLEYRIPFDEPSGG